MLPLIVGNGVYWSAHDMYFQYVLQCFIEMQMYVAIFRISHCIWGNSSVLGDWGKTVRQVAMNFRQVTLVEGSSAQFTLKCWNFDGWKERCGYHDWSIKPYCIVYILFLTQPFFEMEGYIQTYFVELTLCRVILHVNSITSSQILAQYANKISKQFIYLSA